MCLYYCTLGEHGELASHSQLCSLQLPLLLTLLMPLPLARPPSSLLSPRRLLLR